MKNSMKKMLKKQDRRWWKEYAKRTRKAQRKLKFQFQANGGIE